MLGFDISSDAYCRPLLSGNGIVGRASSKVCLKRAGPEEFRANWPGLMGNGLGLRISAREGV